MRRPSFRYLPRSLKNRLIVLFLVFILLPFVILSAYNFVSVEAELQQSASDRDRDKLYSLKQSLQDQIGIMVKTWPMFEQDRAFSDLMRNPDAYEWSDRKGRVESKFSSVANGTFLSGMQVFYTLLDLKGNAYTSYYPNEPLDYDSLLHIPGFQRVLNGPESNAWVTQDLSDVKRDLNRSTQMVSFYALLKDSYYPAHGLLRISMDYEEWFQRVTRSVTESRDEGAFYALAEGGGRTLLVSDPKRQLPKKSLDDALHAADAHSGANWRDQKAGMLYTSAYIPMLDWYLIKGTPLHELFAEVDRMKTRYYTVLAGCVLVFAALTIALSSGITRPLFRLQRKMEAMAGSDLKTVLPETSSTEEIQSLTRSFNRMVQDIHGLVNRLKLEERQKQAVRFQVLLSQMNPHFLLNTLNTVKSIAMQEDQDEIHDICVSLGKLLESGLNLDVDLIHLKEELGLVSAYMQIQNARFGNRFETVFDLDPSLQYALVPKMSLQPLVENAIVHGFGSTVREGNIRISAVMEGKRLLLAVEDDGIGLEAAKARPKRRAHSGVGLSNLRERLHLLYQSQAALTLEEREQGTSARLELPLLLATPYQTGGQDRQPQDHS
ncbi:sensor histidine kinase [Gorillibacterium sp. sgz5001074]|uniref:sensor histidine kinase n=1 Tax=Gorillibacterium sp. sgz5001074 TaxID=3446695 RepID=UPI003F66E10A